MAGHAFVVDRRELSPGRELLDAIRYRPPHPARTGEVLARPGVVDAPGRCRRDAAFQNANRLGDVEVGISERADRRVGLVLHPTAQGVRALELAGRIVAEMSHRLAGS